jgi:hypothetical protein
MKKNFKLSLHCILSFSVLALSAEEYSPRWELTLDDGEVEEDITQKHLAMSPEEQLKKEGSYEISPDQIPKMPVKKTYSSFQALVLPLITIGLVITGIVVTKCNQGQEVS